MAVTCSCGFQLISQSVANNTSTVDFVIWYTTTYGSYNHNGCPSSRTFGGNLSGTASWTGTLDLKQTNREYRRERLTVNHNADGTASISASVAIDTQVSSGTIYASTNYTLPTIARASQPSCVTYPNNTENVGDLGKAITIHMNRASSSFTHTVTYQFGESSGTIATGVTDNCAWTMPLALANQIPNETSGWGTITVKTYNGGTIIGTKTCRFSPTVPTSVVPTISSITPSDTAGYRTTYGAYVQNKSNFRVVTASAGAYSSTIKTIAVAIGGVTVNGSTADFGVRGFVGSQTVTVKVTDSRGRTATKTTSTTWVAYSPPNLSKCWAKRWSGSAENDESATVRFHVEGSVTNINNTGTNKAKIEILWLNGSTWQVHNTQNYGLTYNYNFDSGNWNTNTSYDTKIRVTDSLGTVSEAFFKIDTAKPVMDFLATGNGMAIGKVSSNAGVLEVNYEAQFLKPRYVTNNIDGVSGTGGYVHFCTITNTNAYQNDGIKMTISQRNGLMDLYLMFSNINASTLTVHPNSYVVGFGTDIYSICSANTCKLYLRKSEAHDGFAVVDLVTNSRRSSLNFAWTNELSETIPSGASQIRHLNTHPSLTDGSAHIYMPNDTALCGKTTSGSNVSMLRMNTSNHVELNWTSGGLQGRVRKILWEGNWSPGGNITVSEAPYYNVFIFHFSTVAFGEAVEKMIVTRAYKPGDKNHDGTVQQHGGWLRGGVSCSSSGGDALYVAGITVATDDTLSNTSFRSMRGTAVKIIGGSINTFTTVNNVWRIEGVL